VRRWIFIRSKLKDSFPNDSGIQTVVPRVFWASRHVAMKASMDAQFYLLQNRLKTRSPMLSLNFRTVHVGESSFRWYYATDVQVVSTKMFRFFPLFILKTLLVYEGVFLGFIPLLIAQEHFLFITLSNIIHQRVFPLLTACSLKDPIIISLDWHKFKWESI
jgi:hypothetical protein